MKDTVTYPLSAITGDEEESRIDQLERELAEVKAEIERLKELLEHATDTVENNEQTDNERMHLSPAEQRAAGQPHCPLCYTFGYSHRKECKYANAGMDNHIRIRKGE